MSIAHAVLLSLVVMIGGVLYSAYIQDKLQYNLWDWLKDKWKAFRGIAIQDAQVVIKLSSSEYHHLTDALDKIPAAIKWAIRRR